MRSQLLGSGAMPAGDEEASSAEYVPPPTARCGNTSVTRSPFLESRLQAVGPHLLLLLASAVARAGAVHVQPGQLTVHLERGGASTGQGSGLSAYVTSHP